MPIPSTKICTKCDVEKDRSAFGKENGKSDGLKSNCKSCISIAQKLHREENLDIARDVGRKQAAKHRRTNPDAVRTSFSKWYAKNSKIVIDAAKNWKIENPQNVVVINSRRLEKRRLATEFKHLGDEPVDWVTE